MINSSNSTVSRPRQGARKVRECLNEFYRRFHLTASSCGTDWSGSCPKLDKAHVIGTPALTVVLALRCVKNGWYNEASDKTDENVRQPRRVTWFQAGA